MREICALADETIFYRCRYAREFLNAMYVEKALNFKDLTVCNIMDFVSKRSRQYKPVSAKVLTCSLRSYLRFACLQGQYQQDLSNAVPTVAVWRQGSIPKTLGEDQVKKFFSAFDRSTPTGLRDYAMCLCLFDLGLRSREVAGLRLDDIDWREGTLGVLHTKNHQSRILPLPERLGQDIIDYLRKGRPESSNRALFLCQK